MSEKFERKEILKVVVGSQAHNLADETSDWDYRSVFVTPTSELLKIGVGSYKGSSWIEGENEDNTAYELAHFLHLATKSNPSILEVFKAPRTIAGHYGEGASNPSFDILEKRYDAKMKPGNDLQALFPQVWSSKGVYEAFKGYSHNQHVKLFSEKEEFVKRKSKYAVAHLRVLLSGIELLTCNDFHVQVQDYYLGPGFGEKDGLHIHLPYWAVNELQDQRAAKEGFEESWREYLLAVKRAEIQIGSIVDTAEYLKSELKKAYEKNPNKQTDLDKVNSFLLKVRKENW